MGTVFSARPVCIKFLYLSNRLEQLKKPQIYLLVCLLLSSLSYLAY